MDMNLGGSLFNPFHLPCMDIMMDVYLITRSTSWAMLLNLTFDKETEA